MTNGEKFEWITARAQCSAHEIFEKLRIQVKADVDKAHEDLRPKDKAHGSYYGFRFVSENKKFSALVEGNNIHHSVIFSLDGDDTINVYTDDDTSILKAEITLNKEGKCVAVINDEECELWYLRKLALEKLFFTEY